jgi:aspartate 1-decarboxylase
MSNLEMWMSPLTNRIYVGKSKNGVATSKQDVTAQCINGAIAHLVAINDLEIIVNLDEGRYRVKISAEPAQP